ncbi:conserved Plasmodium protein, unknown function, partial [Plasmodium ovale curtisi]
ICRDPCLAYYISLNKKNDENVTKRKVSSQDEESEGETKIKECNLEKWQPIIEDRCFLEWLVNIPTKEEAEKKGKLITSVNVNKLEELYNKGNILSIREQVKLYIRELVNIISNLLTGNYPILNLPKNGGDFLKKYGGTLMENLKDGNDLAIELYEKQGLYDENFLTYLNEYLIKKSNENEYNKSVISDFNNCNDLLNNLNSSIDDLKIGNNITTNTANSNSMIGGINNGNNIGNSANASNNISSNSSNINNINNLNSSTNSNANFSNSGGNNSMGTTNNNIINNSGIGKNNNSSSSNNNSNINSLNKRSDIYDSFNDRDKKRTNDKLLKVGQTVRFLLAKEESSMFGIVQNISNDVRSKNILVNFFFRSNNIEEQIQVKSVEKERLIVIKPVETLNSDLFFLNGLQVWYKMTRDDGWVGFDKAEIIKVFNNNSKIKDVLIRNLSKNNEVVSIKINDLYADYTDDMDEEADPMEEIYDEDDALKRIAGPHTDLKILNQLAITYI